MKTSIRTIKRITALLCVTSMLTVYSCKTDDDGDMQEEEQMEQEAQQQEQTELDANEVLDGLVIQNSTQVNGNAPQPNGAVTLNTITSSSALQLEGFSIELDSPDDIAGVYLIIEDTDGQAANSYFDIPVSAPLTTTTDTRKVFFGSGHENQRPLSTILDVGFDSSIPVGIFCYSICVYDASGNISLPQQVCVTVQSWGGNASASGDWRLTRYQESYDGMSSDVGLNEDFCYQFTVDCDFSGQVSVEECSNWEYFNFNIASNGDYTLNYRIINKDIDYTLTASTCEEVLAPQRFYEYTSEGRWAYNDNDAKLVLVEYSYQESDNGEIFTGTFNPGQGDLIFDAPVTINGNTLILSFEDGPDDTVSYTFVK